MAVLALMLPLVFWLASRLLQRQILDPLLNLRGEAGAIAGGDLDHAIANTDRRDEIGHLARSFASMRDCRAVEDQRPAGDQPGDRAVRAAGLPGQDRQAEHRRGGIWATTSAST